MVVGNQLFNIIIEFSFPMGLHGVQARNIELFHRCHGAMKLRLKWNRIVIDPFTKATHSVDIITEIQHLFYL